MSASTDTATGVPKRAEAGRGGSDGASDGAAWSGTIPDVNPIQTAHAYRQPAATALLERPEPADDDYAPRQATYAATYQASLERAGGVRTDVDQVGQQALAALVEDISPLLRVILFDKATARFGGRFPDGLIDECYAEMVAAVVDAAARFDPSRCPSFPAWVTGEQGEARAALYACLDFAAGLDNLDERARRALSIANQADTALRSELGRAPSTSELQAAMEEHCYRYQFDRLTPTQQQLPEAEWRKLVRAKLVNNSMLANIRRIESLRQAASRPVTPDALATGWDFLDAEQVSVDTSTAPLEAVEEHRELTGLATVALRGISAQERLIVAARLGQDGPDSTAAAVADRFRVPVSRVRELVADAGARMRAPHAHYAFLAPGVGSQFEEGPGGPDLDIAGLLRRQRPALA